MDKLKILVVDDESRMRKLVRDFLVKRRICWYSKPETVWSNGHCFMRKRILRL